MPTTNHAAREINCKVVYYGPASSGKTTNLRYIHSKLDPATRGKLIAPSTESDRTLFFDFLSVDLGTVRGFRTRFHLYTVPGQVRYNQSRRLVLKGVDGLVFVADSGGDRMEDNIESLANLNENLASHDRRLEDIPRILQINKRDLPDALAVEDVREALRQTDQESFEAVAIEGDGVFESLTAVSKRVIASLG
ncbi:MAG: ATP/GTP-binding protein [Gemmatimonadota bacterium]